MSHVRYPETAARATTTELGAKLLERGDNERQLLRSPAGPPGARHGSRARTKALLAGDRLKLRHSPDGYTSASHRTPPLKISKQRFRPKTPVKMMAHNAFGTLVSRYDCGDMFGFCSRGGTNLLPSRHGFPGDYIEFASTIFAFSFRSMCIFLGKREPKTIQPIQVTHQPNLENKPFPTLVISSRHVSTSSHSAGMALIP